jgi:hypothetical protein
MVLGGPSGTPFKSTGPHAIPNMSVCLHNECHHRKTNQKITDSLNMDPFFGAISGAVQVMVIFMVSVLSGHLVASLTTKTHESRKLVSGLASVAIFAIVFFGLLAR